MSLESQPSDNGSLKLRQSGLGWLLRTSKIAFKGVFALLLALLLLLLPALFMKPPVGPERKLAKVSSDPLGVGSPLPQSRSSRIRKDSTSRVPPQTLSLPSPESAYATYLAAVQSEQVLQDSLDWGQHESTSLSQDDNRAQFSFGRYSAALVQSAPGWASEQIGGITVSGPILSGRALARDGFGRPVASLSQPNLLTAGRGIAASPPESVAATTSASITRRQAVTTPTPAPAPTSEGAIQRSQMGIFDFEEERSGTARVFRNRRGVREQIASFQKLSEDIERYTFIGERKVQTWNEFVGELFLIVVAPELIGSQTIEGFLLHALDANNHLQIVRLKAGDTVRIIGGVESSAFDIEQLPDLLIARSVTLEVAKNAPEGRVFIHIDAR